MYRTGVLTISPAFVTVKADDAQKVTGTVDPAFTATVTGLKNSDSESVLAYTLSRPDNNEDNPDREKSGEHEIVASGEEEQGNYIVEFENGVLTIKKLTITFLNGEDTLRTCELELNQPIGEVDHLAGAVKTGCDFKGWYQENGTEKITSATTFAEDTDLYAHFSVTVRFEADGATNPDPAVLDEGAQIGTLPVVSKEGYRFDGWYRSPSFTGERVTDEDPFHVHTTLYAKFVKQVTVDFRVTTIEANKATTGDTIKSIQIDKGTSLGGND